MTDLNPATETPTAPQGGEDDAVLQNPVPPPQPQPRRTPARPPKKLSIGDMVTNVLNSFVAWLRGLLAKVQDVSGTNYKLGHFHLEKGNFQDAVVRFQLAWWFNKRNREALYWLAEAQALEGRPDRARMTLKKLLSMQPGHVKAREKLDALKARLTPPANPPAGNKPPAA